MSPYIKASYKNFFKINIDAMLVLFEDSYVHYYQKRYYERYQFFLTAISTSNFGRTFTALRAVFS